MSSLAYEDSWEDEFTSKDHENWRNQDLLPETKAILEENERIKSEKRERQERRTTLPFSEPLAIEICERVSSGELLINICADEHLPTVRRALQWIKENPEFAALYRDSINDRLDIFSEEIIRIADDATRDFRDVVRGGRMVRVPDGEQIARAKLRTEMRLKHLRAFRPAIWSEQSVLNVRSSDQNEIDNMTQEEMDKKIAELESKEAVVREPKAA
jgi:hypothetical protein